MSRPFVELVAAVGPRWELGHQGGMPWGRIKGDLALFRTLTEGKAVIMGRRTWESLPPQHRPLKERYNIILSHTMERPEDNDPYAVEQHINAAIWAARGAAKFEGKGTGGVVIIGGGEIYRAALEADLVDVIHLSVIPRLVQEDPLQADIEAVWPHDVTFPALNPRGWALTNNGSSPRFAERREPEEGAPHGWRYAQLVRNPLEPALRPDSDGVPSFWGGAGWWY